MQHVDYQQIVAYYKLLHLRLCLLRFLPIYFFRHKNGGSRKKSRVHDLCYLYVCPVQTPESQT